jgi:energy-coupling factor transport system permease protein
VTRAFAEREDGARRTRTHPLANLLLLGCFVASVLASPGLSVKLAALTLIVLLALLSGESLWFFLDKSRFVLVFSLLLLAAQALFVKEGRPILSLGVSVTDRGLLAGGEMALRFLVIVSSSLLFVRVTDPDRLARAVVGLGAPYRYAFVFVLALRFVPFFREEYRTVREAQQVRGLDRPIRSLADLRRSIRHTFVPVLAAGLVRVDTIAISMKGRAFGLHPTRTVTRRERWDADDLVPLGASAALLAITILARRWTWP